MRTLKEFAYYNKIFCIEKFIFYKDNYTIIIVAASVLNVVIANVNAAIIFASR